MMTYNELVAANRDFRANDDSHLWPIRNRFNVADRAIRRVAIFRHNYGELALPEYIAMVEYETSEIVNNPVNW